MGNDDLIKNLNIIFSEKSFIKTILTSYNPREYCKERPFEEAMIEKFAIVFNYYILTRDLKNDYSFEEIKRKYIEIIKEGNFEKYKSNIINNGYVTHSFNGNEKEFIEKYGFEHREYIYNLGYLINSGKISIEDGEKIRKRQYLMNELESKSKSKNEYYTRPHEVFVCMPGETTFNYVFKYSPEKLFNGPLKDINEPIVIGETKKEFMERVLIKRIGDEKLSNEIAKEFCSKPSCFAMIKIKDIENEPIYYASTLNEKHVLKDILEDEQIKNIEDVLSSSYIRKIHKSRHRNLNLTDMVMKKDSISKDNIKIVRVPDIFYLKQLYAKTKGVSEGEKIDYNTCEQIEAEAENKKCLVSSWDEDR